MLAALWLASHPYQGVFHDSRLYTLQALAAHDPARYGADLFLAFGSQDRFTLFSPLYRPFVAVLGVGSGNMTLLLLVAALWVASAAALAGGWLGDRRLAVAGAAAAIALPGGIVFVYGEGFLTPRLLAEALVLLALAALVRGRPFAAAAGVAAAGLFHPLTALPAAALLFLHESRDRRWLWLAAVGAVAAGIGLALAGVDPFARLLQRFDSEWLAIIARRDNYCFIGNWTGREWLSATNVLAVAVLAVARGPVQARRLLALALLVGGSGMALAAIGGDLLHNVLITNIQPWRWVWLAALLGNMAAGALVVTRPWRLESGLAAFALACLAASTTLPALALLVAPAAVAALFAGRIAGNRPLRLLLIVAAALAIASVLSAAMQRLGPAPAIPPLVGLALVAAIVLAIVLAPRGRAALAVVALTLFVATVMQWDQRLPWKAYVDTSRAASADLVALLPANAHIYWEGDMTVPWFVLHRPNYFSCEQGAGVLFSRANAVAWQHRADSFAPLNTLDFQRYSFCRRPAGADPVQRDGAALARLCRREPGLGAIVLTRPLPGVTGRQWTAPATFRDVATGGPTPHNVVTNRFHIYACPR